MNKDIRMKPIKGHKSLRSGRYSHVGYVYHLTFTTKDRQKYFSEFTLARQFINILKRDQALGFTKTLAFVVMPDHVHWLVELVSGSLDRAVKRIKSVFTKDAGLAVWGYGFHDHAIRSDESLINVARYIVANPLRAGLVNRVEDYSHWDSIWLE
jgi:REP element-mobilizing transposase RayT